MILKKIFIYFLFFLQILYSKERFSHSGNVVFDFEKELIWEDQKNIKKANWIEANEYCKKLELDGHLNWRLPHLHELESIYINENLNNKDWKINEVFNYTSRDWYWSKTKFHSNSMQSWLMRFYNSCGEIGLDLSFKHSVRCVKSIK
jgi:hypothetical protein